MGDSDCLQPMVLPLLCSFSADRINLLTDDMCVTGCRQCMKESKGTANPGVMNKILMQKLNAK